VWRFVPESPPERLVVVDDTTNYMAIDCGHVVEIEGTYFLIRGNEREGRFGIDDQPKFWVKRAVDLRTGRTHILKLVFHEEFHARVGSLHVKCVRSPEKEGQVLELVRGDPWFMQGRTARDVRGNLVRVIDHIPGLDLLSYIHSLPAQHEEYFQTHFPAILPNVIGSLRGIERLHDAGLCHGDIRNDHLLIERDSGQYKWIDFDLNENFLDFDVWSAGNILHCVVGRGFVSFRDAIQASPELAGRLSDEDASVFFPHRVMNLRKVFPYVPARLNEVLLRFSAGVRVFYDKISQVVDDLEECTAVLRLSRAT
jgi:serine/threonine protein kinase